MAFVAPRFGASVVGGSEAVTREMATGLASRGWDVDVVTTCAVDHYTWANELAPGVTEEEGVRVHRFPAVHHFSRAGRRAQLAIQAGRIPVIDDQVSWLSWRFTSPELYQHLLRHGEDYQAAFFSPYMFWTTSVCLPAVAERAVSVPCLHDETYARLDVLRPALSSAALVWFLSEPEHDLAHRLGEVSPRHVVGGAGVATPDGYDPEGFRSRYGLTRPFVVYAGRREADKGWPWLLQAWKEAVEGGLDVDLLTMGVGDTAINGGLAGRVHDLGFVSAAERDNALAAALAYVQPSRMESFSRTVMEAWLAGTPVVSLEASEVVSWHIGRSGGGLTVADGSQLCAAIRRLASSPGQSEEMAQQGRNYVLANYTWPAVLDRLELALAEFN
ncbi:MAG: glycosyltransferase family 4 protein [Acidimicrobiales bacterium]